MAIGIMQEYAERHRKYVKEHCNGINGKKGYTCVCGSVTFMVIHRIKKLKLMSMLCYGCLRLDFYHEDPKFTY